MNVYLSLSCPDKEIVLTLKNREKFCVNVWNMVQDQKVRAEVDFCGVVDVINYSDSIEDVRKKFLKPWWFRLFVNPEVRSGVKAFLVTALLIGLPSPSFGVAFFSALSIPVAVFCFHKMNLGVLTAASIVFNAVRNFLNKEANNEIV